ncbi:hypothetical protein C1646_718643 [Rhizophagus diaphanus]|nr:hypothetical protein C1646_718643 [Rhizophagus diaphanus] [Rhizophagus sp. MUCL 43196]
MERMIERVVERERSSTCIQKVVRSRYYLKKSFFDIYDILKMCLFFYILFFFSLTVVKLK